MDKYHKHGQILKSRNSWNLGPGSNQDVYYEPILKYKSLKVVKAKE